MAFSVACVAQKDAGNIVGSVRDQTGAIVAKAKVTVSDVERGTNLETTTNDSGEYVAGPLRVGTYTVTVEHPGFKKQSRPVSLDVQQRIALDVILQVGQISESVEVTSSTPCWRLKPPNWARSWITNAWPTCRSMAATLPSLRC